MKFIRLFSFFLLSFIFFSGCSMTHELSDEISQTDVYMNGDCILCTSVQSDTSLVLDEFPKIDVFVNETPILCVGVQSDISPALSELSNFKSIMNESDNLPYVKWGETIELKLGFMTNESKIEIYDRILLNNGSDKYSTSAMKIIDGDLIDNKVVFDLDENKAALASSDSDDYAPGATIRGFSFSVEINEKKYVYAFALRTDASQACVNN